MSDNNTKKNSGSSSRGHDYADDSWVPKIKRRRRFTADETKILEGEYDKNSSPNQDKIQTIADIIDTPRKIVTTWFQNRRAKNKRKEKTRREENDKRKFRAKHSIKDDDNYIDDENETGSENYDEDPQNEMYLGDNSGSGSQHNYCRISQSEVPVDDEGFDLSFDTSTLITQADSSNQHINRNRPDFFPINTFSQYYSAPQNNQQYSINIYNNMNNYFHPNQYEETLARGTRNLYNMNQLQLQDLFYYQQLQNELPFFINNNINRGMVPFLMNSIPSAPTDGLYPELYINPLDLCLNYYASQWHQQTEEQEDYN